MIIGAVFMHSFTDRLILKSDTYPLRLVMIRILEFIGKVFIIPCVFLYFCIAFPTFGHHPTVIPTLVVMFFMFSFVASREAGGFRHAMKLSMVMIRNKIESPATYSLTNLELLIFNIKMFGVISRSPAHYHRWKRQVDKKLAEDGMDGASGGGDSSDDPVPVEMEMAAMQAAHNRQLGNEVTLLHRSSSHNSMRMRDGSGSHGSSGSLSSGSRPSGGPRHASFGSEGDVQSQMFENPILTATRPSSLSVTGALPQRETDVERGSSESTAVSSSSTGGYEL